MIACLIIVCFTSSFLANTSARAVDFNLNLPTPGTMISLSPAFEPALIKGLTVHKDNPFLFDFIVDSGTRSQEELKTDADRLIKYFFACLTIPEKDLWVNLSPYEKDRMIPQALGQTVLGRDLLAQDYILKQLTASMIYPEKNLGKEFWERVYTRARELYGTADVPVNTFNKVWILADKASVYENGQTVFVLGGHLKVMLEEDYLSLEKHSTKTIPKNDVSALGSQVIRQIILPELEKEVNSGQNFATLRQIFNSLILANWYKDNLKLALLNKVYSNKSAVKGVNLNDLSVTDRIYHQYLKAYKKGVFNYIKEDSSADGQMIPRKYFSGGFGESPTAAHPNVYGIKSIDLAQRTQLRFRNNLSEFTVALLLNRPSTVLADHAMAVAVIKKLYSDHLKRSADARVEKMTDEELIDALGSRNPKIVEAARLRLLGPVPISLSLLRSRLKYLRTLKPNRNTKRYIGNINIVVQAILANHPFSNDLIAFLPSLGSFPPSSNSNNGHSHPRVNGISVQNSHGPLMIRSTAVSTLNYFLSVIRSVAANKEDAAMKVNGGIDLTKANSGITVTKNVHGGVKVNFDPSMLARIMKEGVQSAVPVILNVTAISPAQVRPLLGFNISQP